jgi:membrane protein implicated in regulation of membrane protease activity
METRVKACQREHSGSFKRANMAGLAGALIAFATLIVSKLTSFSSTQLTWDTVALVPFAVYAVVFIGMLWTFARAMKRSRALDEADQQSFASARGQS